MNSIRINLFIFIVSLTLLSCSAQNVDLKQLKCLVCRTVVEEYEDEVNKIDPSNEIEIGQYKLDSKGNAIQKKIQLSSSEVHLSEMLESICKKMEDYVRATYKSSGKLTLMKLMTNNELNPLFQEVDVVQDGDLNKSLEYFCTDIINEHEDAFVEAVIKKEKNLKFKICSDIAEYCTDFTDDSNDYDEDKFDHTSEDEFEDIKTEL